MPILKNQRHELFAQGVASGKSARQAYICAGYEKKQAGACSTRLLQTNANVRARIDELKQKFVASIEKRSIAAKEVRLAILDDLLDRQRRLVQARAAEHAAIPGGETGLIVRQLKSIGFGANNQVLEEYAFDAALVREMRATLEQVAEETDTKKPAESASEQPREITYRWAEPGERTAAAEDRPVAVPGESPAIKPEVDQLQ